MKGTRNLTVLIILGLVLILGVWSCSGYNGLVTSEQGVKKAWSNVETNYQRRTDLYSSVIKTVEANLQGSFSRLIASFEQYPDLKTTKAFQDFQTQIEGTENRINVARQDYNKTVESYNLKVVRFPTNLLAGIFGKKEKAFYEADKGSEKNPDIKFDIK
jgi:LemA protein